MKNKDSLQALLQKAKTKNLLVRLNQKSEIDIKNLKISQQNLDGAAGTYTPAPEEKPMPAQQFKFGYLARTGTSSPDATMLEQPSVRTINSNPRDQAQYKF